MSHPSRRDVIVFGVGVGAGVATLAGCGAPGTSNAIPAGPVTDYSVGTLKSVSGWSLFVGRDANGLYAMSSLCTHQGCDMAGTYTSSGPYCNCHGSTFSPIGAVLSGVARQALQHYAVSVSASGEVTVDGTTPVAMSVRTAV